MPRHGVVAPKTPKDTCDGKALTMSTNALGNKSSRIGRMKWIPTHGFLNVLDPCCECSGAARYGCKAWEGCTRRPRPHPMPNIRRVHVDKVMIFE